jgi:CheY-like chemotaxis protein
MHRCLIVDDQEENLYLLEFVLEGAGYEVERAENGASALQKARHHPPDVVISDILMPVMDGYALCREWKADEKLKHIPFIFYTATYTDPKDRDFALSLGADRFVIKPQEPDVLLRLVREVLDESYFSMQVAARPLGEEMEIFRQHNEILFRKLEKKDV